MKLFAALIAVAIAIEWLGLSGAIAGEPTVEQQLAEFRSRIESLERENGDLRQAIVAPADGRPLLLPPETGTDSAVGHYHDFDQRLSDLETRYALEPANLPPPAACVSEGDVDGRELGMNAGWHHGFEAARRSDDFRVHVGGRTQVDAGWFDADQTIQDNINTPYADGASFRRARLRVDGTMYGFIDWAAEYDFVNGILVDGVDRSVTAPTDLWVTIKDLPLGNLRIGNQKPAIGFEHLVSSRFLPFMERSYNQDTFYGGSYNGFWPGISLFDNYSYDDSGSWNVGVFKPTDNVFAASANDGDYAAVARLTKLLWYEREGERLFHVGVSGMQQSTVANRTVFRTRDAIRTGLPPSWPVPATTGTVDGNDMQWLNWELAAVRGPLTLQAEYLISRLSDAAPLVGGVVQPSVGDVVYQGGYFQMLYYLTGEHDNYDKATGVFTRVTPHENFIVAHDDCGNRRRLGSGAWQVGARYNYLDLNDNDLDGGILHNLTVGLNWFLNPNLKLQFNYMGTHRDAPLADDLGDGWINGWGTRMALDF